MAKIKTLPALEASPMYGRPSFTVRWVDAENNRYHIWFHRNVAYEAGAGNLEWLPTRDNGKVTVFMNPPQGVKSSADSRYFSTRKFNAESGKWEAVLAAATEYANSGAPQKAEAERREREEAEAQVEAAKATDAHGAATKERLHAFADWLGEHMPSENLPIDVRRIADRLTNAQADRLSAYVHDLVQP